MNIRKNKILAEQVKCKKLNSGYTEGSIYRIDLGESCDTFLPVSIIAGFIHN